jgi:hypothetical protein
MLLYLRRIPSGSGYRNDDLNVYTGSTSVVLETSRDIVGPVSGWGVGFVF